jgi:ATPase components of various ABC-type transport systems, contain duplicated ATPase
LLLIITHDLEFILKTCTYIVHIENGEVLEQYSLDEEGKEKLFRFFNS